ncbi:MAG: class I SAM-dependent methyltransferase [Patescibacteria group bacterium]
MKDHRNSDKWTYWRKSNFDYFVRHFKNLENSDRVLDVGAGPQQFRVIFQNCQLTTLDFKAYDGIDVVADLNEGLPFEDNLYDYVFLSNVLEHIPEPKNLLSECFRVLKPKGRILITVPFMLKLHQLPFDFFRYTNFGLEHLFKESGFSSIEITKLGGIDEVQDNVIDVFFVTLLKNLHKDISNYWLRFLPKLFLLFLKKSIKFIIKIANLFNSDVQVLNGKEYILGYGVVAEKI